MRRLILRAVARATEAALALRERRYTLRGQLQHYRAYVAHLEASRDRLRAECERLRAHPDHHAYGQPGDDPTPPELVGCDCDCCAAEAEIAMLWERVGGSGQEADK